MIATASEANCGRTPAKTVPAVSVVIPTFNRADMVGQAIDSVLQQSFTDFEIVVVDDGSTDDTEVRILEYGDRVRYVKTNNGGVAHARNVGMRTARGRYLTFLDSDDLLYPYALELQTGLLERFPDTAFVCAEMSGFDDAGFFDRRHLKTYHRSAYRDPSVTYDSIFESSLPLADAVALPLSLTQEDPSAGARRVYLGNVFDSYLLNIVLCQNTVMLRSEIVSVVGVRNERVKHWQELEYLLRISRRHTVCFADIPTYKLRYHDGQISSTARADGTRVWMRKQQILLRVVKRHALADPAYYLQHRPRIDRHLAHLHRAAAVPMLLLGGRRTARRQARAARLHLARCATYGQPARVLLAASFAPAPIRHAIVKLVETVRQLRWTVIQRLSSGVTSVVSQAGPMFAERLQ